LSKSNPLASPWYWFKKIAREIIKLFNPAIVRLKSFVRQHQKPIALVVLAVVIVFAVAYYGGITLLICLLLLTLGAFLFERKQRRLAIVAFVTAGLVLFVPWIVAATQGIHKPKPLRIPATVVVVEKKESDKKLSSPVVAVTISTPPAPKSTTSALPCKKDGAKDWMAQDKNSVIENPIAPARKGGSIPCIPDPVVTTNVSPTTWPPPESLPNVALNLTKTVSLLGVSVTLPAKAEGAIPTTKTPQDSNAKPCRTMSSPETAHEEFGEVQIVIEKCHRSGTQEEFSGVARYKGTDKRLLVLHKFIVSDNAGEKYHVQAGHFGKNQGSRNFGMEYSYQWLYPGIPVDFSFIVGSIDEKALPESISLVMLSNLPDGDTTHEFVFTDLIEAR
jgi:energy-coupling factor transporter transmembrane protein EcfT